MSWRPVSLPTLEPSAEEWAAAALGSIELNSPVSSRRASFASHTIFPEACGAFDIYSHYYGELGAESESHE